MSRAAGKGKEGNEGKEKFDFAEKVELLALAACRKKKDGQPNPGESAQKEQKIVLVNNMLHSARDVENSDALSVPRE